MYNKYGRFFSLAAKFLGVVGIIASLALGIAAWGAEKLWSDYTTLDVLLEPVFEDGVSEFLVGLLIIAVGVTQSCLMYAFGEVIEAVKGFEEGGAKTNFNKTKIQGVEYLSLTIEEIEHINELKRRLKEGIITEEEFAKALEIERKRATEQPTESKTSSLKMDYVKEVNELDKLRADGILTAEQYYQALEHLKNMQK